MIPEIIPGRHLNIRLALSDEQSRQGIVIPKMCHGDHVVEVETGAEDVSLCDALVTKRKDISLGITTADCAPVCFGDGTKIAVAHVGWPGLCLKLHSKVLKLFKWNQVEVFVGPFMHVFELQRDFCYDALKEKYGELFFYEEGNKLYFRFKDALASELPPQTTFDARSTFLDPMLPSYRRDKTSKRLITVVQFS